MEARPAILNPKKYFAVLLPLVAVLMYIWTTCKGWFDG